MLGFCSPALLAVAARGRRRRDCPPPLTDMNDADGAPGARLGRRCRSRRRRTMRCALTRLAPPCWPSAAAGISISRRWSRGAPSNRCDWIALRWDDRTQSASLGSRALQYVRQPRFKGSGKGAICPIDARPPLSCASNYRPPSCGTSVPGTAAVPNRCVKVHWSAHEQFCMSRHPWLALPSR